MGCLHSVHKRKNMVSRNLNFGQSIGVYLKQTTDHIKQESFAKYKSNCVLSVKHIMLSSQTTTKNVQSVCYPSLINLATKFQLSIIVIKAKFNLTL